jgi:hypothetical protein
VDPNILVQVCGVVKCNSLKTLKVGSEFVQLSEAAASFPFDLDFDLADPSTL